MILTLLTALFLAQSFETEIIQKGCVWFIAIQSCSSYFISGIVKLRKRNWRSGKALQAFLQTTIYLDTPWFKLILSSSTLAILLSWLIIVFEVAFPFSLIGTSATYVLLAVGFLFHMTNAYVFGLNRFFFAWVASYPAIVATSTMMAEVLSF